MSGFVVIRTDTGERVYEGEWPTEDGARCHVVRMQRAMNRKGYSPLSEKLGVAQLAPQIADPADAENGSQEAER